MFDIDPLILSRIQFAFTISFHIIFPALSIGLASFLAVLEWRWLATGNGYFRDIYRFWIKIFAVTFGMGVVSGVVMSYEFGTNWSIFSDKIANVLGPLLSFEVLTAFFLEASFLGIMLFGWGRVSKRMHFFSTCTVAIGTLISAFWIISANSWMQTPQGFSVSIDGRFMPTDWLSIIFNPSFPYRFTHMVTAAYLTTAFVVGGVAAFYLWNQRYLQHARIMLGMSVILVGLLAPTQLFLGHAHGENTLEHQPVKVAAMEGNWDVERHVPLYLFAWPDVDAEMNHYALRIPDGASWILTGSPDGKVPTLKSFPQTDRPNVPIVFWSFRVMVGLGVTMIVIGLFSALQYFRKRLFTSKVTQLLWMLMMPSGFISILAGWFVTEAGRQPWVVYGLLRTAEAVSPAITGPQVMFSLLAFVLIYTIIFGAASYYILKLIARGISVKDDEEGYYKHGIEFSVVEDPEKK